MLRSQLILAQRAIALKKQQNPDYADFHRFVEGIVNNWLDQLPNEEDLFADAWNEPAAAPVQDEREHPNVVLHDIELDADLIQILGAALKQRQKLFEYVVLSNVKINDATAKQLISMLLDVKKNLKSIVLSRNELTDDCINDLIALDTCTNALDLSGNRLTNNGALKLCLSKFNRLDLSCNRLNKTFINDLIYLITENKLQLSYLDISGNNFDDEDKENLKKALKTHKPSCEIIIENNQIKQKEFEAGIVCGTWRDIRHNRHYVGVCESTTVSAAIGSLLKCAKRELDITNEEEKSNHIIDTTAVAICTLTNKNDGLKQLCFSRRENGFNGANVLNDCLSKGVMIDSLSFARSQNQEVERYKTKQLAALLNSAVNAPLMSLNLAFQYLNDKHAIIIAEYLSKNPTLQELNIDISLITNKGLNAILTALESNTNLRKISLQGGKYNKEGTAAIVKMAACNHLIVEIKCDYLSAEQAESIAACTRRNMRLNTYNAMDRCKELRKIVAANADMPQAYRERILNEASIPTLQTLIVDAIHKRNQEIIATSRKNAAESMRADRLKSLIAYTESHSKFPFTNEIIDIMIATGGMVELTINWWLNGADFCKPEALIVKLRKCAVKENNENALFHIMRAMLPKPVDEKEKEDVVHRVEVHDSHVEVVEPSNPRDLLTRLEDRLTGSKLTTDELFERLTVIQDGLCDVKTEQGEYESNVAIIEEGINQVEGLVEILEGDDEINNRSSKKDDNNVSPQKEVPYELVKLQQFITNEILILNQPHIFKKGISDKLCLFNRVLEMINQLMVNHESITLDAMQNVLNQTAIIAHHRRRSKWNSAFSIFNKNLKSSDSWRRFVIFINEFPEASPLCDILNQLQPGKRIRVRVIMPNEVSCNVGSYNEYRTMSHNNSK